MRIPGRTGFRSFRRSRPFWGALWVLLGGSIVTYWPTTAYKFMFTTASVTEAIAVGVVIVVLGAFIMFAPAHRKLYSVFAVLAGVLSLITSDIGGFVLGMLLTLIGGSMAFAWTPLGEVAHRHRHRGHRLLHRRAAAPEPDYDTAA